MKENKDKNPAAEGGSRPPLNGILTERIDFSMTTAEKAKAARNEYMRRYRQTPQGREKIKAAQNRYWERKFDAMQDAQPTNEREDNRP